MDIKFYLSKMSKRHRSAIRHCVCSQQCALDAQKFKKVDLVLTILTITKGNTDIHAQEYGKKAPPYPL